jgi:hypothetical protein
MFQSVVGFVRRVLIFALLQTLIAAAVAAIYFERKPIADSYLAATIDKHRLLQGQASPRIILVGGSNVAFGFDSQALQAATRSNPVNMGLIGGVGLDFMLNELSGAIRRGDMVVVSPEYELFGRDYFGDAPTLFGVITSRPASARYLSARQIPTLLDDAFSVAGEMTRFSLSRIGGIRAEDLPVVPFARRAFDERGDIRGHYGLPNRPILTTTTFHMTDRDISRAVVRLSAFQEECRKHGAIALFSFPPLRQRDFDQNATIIDRINTRLRAESSLAVLETPEEMALPEDDFFDSRYHLNRIGTIHRTERVINALRSAGFLRFR